MDVISESLAAEVPLPTGQLLAMTDWTLTPAREPGEADPWLSGPAPSPARRRCPAVLRFP
jgi:hypothetical protein